MFAPVDVAIVIIRWNISLILPTFIIYFKSHPVFAQTISNIADLDSNLPNFYKWMEQNAYICENSSPDAPIFLTEPDAEQFNCAALCGDPIDFPHLACAKRPSQRARADEWPRCHSVPPLCVLNFVQEFLALRIARGQFNIANLLTSDGIPQRQRHQFSNVESTPTIAITPKSTTTETPSPSSLAPPPSDIQFAGNIFQAIDNFGGIPSSSEKREGDFRFVEVDGNTQRKTDDNKEHRKTTITREQRTFEQPTNIHFLDKKTAGSLDFKDAIIPNAGSQESSKLTFTENEQKCPPDTDTVSCKFWAQIGECKINPVYMQRECRWACGLCGNSRKGKRNSEVN